MWAQTQQAAERTLTIIAVGDIMLGSSYPNPSYLPPNDGADLLEQVKPLTQKADIVFGNLEGCLLTGEGPAKKSSDPKICFAFKMPEHYVKHLKDAHFNLLSTANNHVGDFGEVGRRNTAQVLQKAGIHFASLQEYPYTKATHLLFYCAAWWERIKCWQRAGYVGRGSAEGAAVPPQKAK